MFTSGSRKISCPLGYVVGGTLKTYTLLCMTFPLANCCKNTWSIADIQHLSPMLLPCRGYNKAYNVSYIKTRRTNQLLNTEQTFCSWGFVGGYRCYYPNCLRGLKYVGFSLNRPWPIQSISCNVRVFMCCPLLETILPDGLKTSG